MGAHGRTVVIRICSWRLGVLPEKVLEVQGGSRRCRGKPGLQNGGLRGPAVSFKSIGLRMKYALYMSSRLVLRRGVEANAPESGVHAKACKL